MPMHTIVLCELWHLTHFQISKDSRPDHYFSSTSNPTMAKDMSEPAEDRKLRGHTHFVRSNPKSDKFEVQRFHHLEFYALDATSTAKRCDTHMPVALRGSSLAACKYHRTSKQF